MLALEAYLCCMYLQPCSFPLLSQAFLLCIPEKQNILCDSQVNIYGDNKSSILAISLLSWRHTCSNSLLRGGSSVLQRPKQALSLREMYGERGVLSGIPRALCGVMAYQHFNLIILAAKTWNGSFLWG